MVNTQERINQYPVASHDTSDSILKQLPNSNCSKHKIKNQSPRTPRALMTQMLKEWNFSNHNQHVDAQHSGKRIDENPVASHDTPRQHSKTDVEFQFKTPTTTSFNPQGHPARAFTRRNGALEGETMRFTACIKPSPVSPTAMATHKKLWYAAYQMLLVFLAMVTRALEEPTWRESSFTGLSSDCPAKAVEAQAVAAAMTATDFWTVTIKYEERWLRMFAADGGNVGESLYAVDKDHAIAREPVRARMGSQFPGGDDWVGCCTWISSDFIGASAIAVDVDRIWHPEVTNAFQQSSLTLESASRGIVSFCYTVLACESIINGALQIMWHTAKRM